METKPKIRIGSRESKLAVIQSEIVQRHLQEKYPEGEITLITMKTTGDKILDRTLDKIGGKGLFVKELDLALMEKRTDLSVHSLKDMPMEVPEELPILAFSRRKDPRDVLVLPKGKTEIDFSKPIGCSSMRRILQFQKLYPQAVFKPIRGNVQTRLRKLDDGEYSATLLAAAGLKRLGLENRISRYFEPEEMIPAAGQGILAVQGRKDTDVSCMEGFADQDALWAALAERSFVRTLDGGCSSPIAAYAKTNGGTMTLLGLYYSETKKVYETGSIQGNCADAENLGKALAEHLRHEVEESV